MMIGSTFQTKEVEEAIRRFMPKIPVIMVNGYLEMPNVRGVLADERSGVSALVKLLVEKGHRHLAFVNNCYTPSNRLKIHGFEEELARQGIEGPALIYDAETTIESAYDVTRRLMQEHPQTDGIIYSVDLLASGGGRALLDMNCSVPDQVAYTGIDNSIYAEFSTPKITSLDNKLPELSLMASRFLVDLLEGRNVTEKMMVFSSVVERETT